MSEIVSCMIKDFKFPEMNELEDDSWVREFDVSNPQKTHAGYTVYRVSSKVNYEQFMLFYILCLFVSLTPG